MEFEIPSDSGGKVHHITVIFKCDCMAYRYSKGLPGTKTCKHIQKALAQTHTVAA